MVKLLNGVAALALATVALPLYAQPASAQVTPQQPATPEAVTGLEDVVVTAQRRSESSQRAAIAVTAVSSEVLTAQVTRGEDLAKLVPSVVIGQGGGGTNLTSIRGIGTLASNGLLEQVVAVNLDGVYLARPAAANGLFYDLERTEVLKGPQGTLYGRNATAGAINVVTHRPTFVRGGQFSSQFGNYDHVQAQGALNLPLSDTVALRLAGQTVKHDGYFSDGYNDQDQYSGRASLLVQPNDDLSFLATADYVHFGGQGAANVISPFVDPSNPYLGPSEPAANQPYTSFVIPFLAPNGLPPIKNDGFNDTDLFGIYGTMTWNTGAGELTVTPAYRKSDINYRHYAAGFQVDNVEGSEQTSLEVRYATPEGHRLTGIIGGYYFNEEGDFQLDPYVFAPPGGFPFAATARIDDYQTESYAVFGQATFHVSDTVRLVGGLRYTNEAKTVQGASFNPVTGASVPILGDVEFDRVNWRAGVEIDLAPRSLFYATVATGFKAGGFFTAAAPNSYDPETLTAYTIGSKNRFFDNRLQLNLETYYWDYQDKQVSHLLGPTLVTENAGSATLYGAELESSFLATPDDLISANILYNHATYDDFSFQLPATAFWNCKRTPSTQGNVTLDCSGNVIQQSPKWSVNLNYEHTFNLENSARVVLRASGVYRSGYWLGDERAVGQFQKGYITADASLTYNAPDDKWYVGAYVQNIGDEAVKSSSFITSQLRVPIVTLYAPRTYGIRLGVNF